MNEDFKKKIVVWLTSKSIKDKRYLKKDPEKGIFLKHLGMTDYEAEKLIEEPERIIEVKRNMHFNNRLEILYPFSKKYNLQYIILDPFHPLLDIRFKDNVWFITFYPVKKKQ